MCQADLKPMKRASGYGEGLGSRLRAQATTFVCSLHNTTLAVTELRSENPEHGLSAPLVREDAFLVAHHLVDYPDHEYFENQKPAAIASLRAGDTTLHDLKRSPQFLINKHLHSVFFYFHHSALDLIADDAAAPRIEELSYEPGVGAADATISAIAGSLILAFAHPEQASRLFVEHLITAVGAHVAQVYGGMRLDRRMTRGGLAPWQERRAKEVMSAKLHGDLALAQIARECGLSISHFARAFRQSVGDSPHQWLLRHRVERAKDLLRNSRLPLSDIAGSCGFADQSHFTRVFSRLAGTAPGAWRRTCCA